MTAWKAKRNIMKRYDITAQIYDERYFEEQHRKYQKALEQVNMENLTVLDVGCGSGLFFAHAIAEQAKMVVGVDVSHGLLLKAKKQAKQFENIFLVQSDADHLPFRENFFGAAVAFTMLQNIPKPAQTLTELRRVVKTGGKVIVTGLKKAYTLSEFMDLLENSELVLRTFIDEEPLNCYVAVLTAP